MNSITVMKRASQIVVEKNDGMVLLKRDNVIEIKRDVLIQTVGTYHFIAPLVSSYPDVSIPKSTAITDGYLSAADWIIFNSKQPSGNYLTKPVADGYYLGISAQASDSALLQGHNAAYFQVAGSYITDAPSDSKTYGRKNGAWLEVTSGVADHSLLSNLDYAHAGHTGFQPAGSYLTSLTGAWLNATAQIDLTGDKTGSFNLNTTGYGRFDGGIGVGVSPTSAFPNHTILNASSDMTEYAGLNSEINYTGNTGTSAGLMSNTNISGNNSEALGVDIGLYTSGVYTNQFLVGYNADVEPHAAGNRARGVQLTLRTSDGSSINDPTQDQIAGWFYNNINGTDANNKRWAIYNASTDTTAGKVLLGLNSVKTYWGTLLHSSIYDNGTDTYISSKENSGTGKLYLNGVDSATYLTSVTAHNVLSATHGDTLTDSVVAGDILIGNATPKWARLAKGTDGYVLTIDSSTHLPSWKAAAGGSLYVDSPLTGAGTSASHLSMPAATSSVNGYMTSTFAGYLNQDVKSSGTPTFVALTTNSKSSSTGLELTTNGYFTLTTGWTLNGATIYNAPSGGYVDLTGGGQAQQFVNVIAGHSYTLSFNIYDSGGVSGTMQVYIANTPISPYYTVNVDYGVFTITFTPTATGNLLFNANIVSGYMDIAEISLKENIPAGKILEVQDAVLSGAFYIKSDRKLKSNLQAIDSSSDRNLYQYDINGKTMVGLMADEMPKNVVQDIIVDKEPIQTINTYSLIASMYVEIGQLKDKIKALESKTQ